MDYKFTQKVTREDYVSFVKNHMRVSFLKPFNVALFVISIGYLTISPFLIPAAERNFTFTFIGLGILAFLVVMVIFGIRNAGKQYDKSESEFTMSYEVNDEGLVYIVNEGNIEKKWGEFYSVHEREEYLYIYVNKNSGMVIVKRDAGTDIVNFVKDKLKQSVRPNKVKLMK